MILLDTHAWIWWASDPERLSKPAAHALRSAKAVGISAISCWEVATLVAKCRIRLDRDPLEWIEQGLALPNVQLLPLTPAISVRSTQLGRMFHGDPCDRILVATALLESATLVTKDEQIRKYPAIQTVW